MAFAAIGGAVVGNLVGGGIGGAIAGGLTSAGIGALTGGKGGGSTTTNTSTSRVYDPFETRANDTATGINRGMWEYAKQFYHPIEQELIDKSMNVNEDDVFWRGHQAQMRTQSAYNGLLRDLARQGVTMSDQQMATLNRHRDLDIATGRAAAQNQDRVAQYDRNLNTLGTLAGYGRSTLGLALQSANAAAGMESSRNVSGGYTDVSTAKTTSKSKSGSL